jgi:hypothetical protein
MIRETYSHCLFHLWWIGAVRWHRLLVGLKQRILPQHRLTVDAVENHSLASLPALFL